MSEIAGEPQTPKEIAEHKVAMAVRDGWLAMGELMRLRRDPFAAEFIADHEGDILSLQFQCTLILADIDVTANKPRLSVVSNG